MKRELKLPGQSKIITLSPEAWTKLIASVEAGKYPPNHAAMDQKTFERELREILGLQVSHKIVKHIAVSSHTSKLMDSVSSRPLEGYSVSRQGQVICEFHPQETSGNPMGRSAREILNTPCECTKLAGTPGWVKGRIAKAGDGLRPPEDVACACRQRDIQVARLERISPTLLRSHILRAKPAFFNDQVGNLLDHSVWVTAPDEWFRAHLLAAVRVQPSRFAWVITDATIEASRFLDKQPQNNDSDRGDEAEGTHVDSALNTTMSDIAGYAGVLIIQFGVSGSGKILDWMHGVILERRAHGLETWVWDTPTSSLERHRAYRNSPLSSALAPMIRIHSR